MEAVGGGVLLVVFGRRQFAGLVEGREVIPYIMAGQYWGQRMTAVLGNLYPGISLQISS